MNAPDLYLGKRSVFQLLSNQVLIKYFGSQFGHIKFTFISYMTLWVISLLV